MLQLRIRNYINQLVSTRQSFVTKINNKRVWYKLYTNTWKIVHLVITFGICFIILQPLIQKISTAFMSLDDVFDISVVYIPREGGTQFISMVYKSLDYPISLFNTVLMCSLVALAQVFSCSFVGYGFARFKFPGRSIFFGLLLFTLVVPPSTIIIPQYVHFRYFDIFNIVKKITGSPGINIINSFWPFVLTSLTVMGYKNALYVFLLRQFYRGMNKDIEEAAYLDGCGTVRTYFQIMTPSAAPILMTCFLFSFVWQWTDGFFISYYAPDVQLLTTKLSTLVYDVNYNLMREVGISTVEMIPLGYEVPVSNTGVLFVVLPLLIIYVFAQRVFTESIERSGIK